MLQSAAMPPGEAPAPLDSTPSPQGMGRAGGARRMLVRLALEIAVYTALVVVYLELVLHFLTSPLTWLARQDAILYAGLALGLIVLQGIVLEFVTRFLLDRLGM